MQHVKHIENLKCYIDDNCSFARLNDTKYYRPYNKYFPTDQTKLLELWDEIGLPHEEWKQIYGPIIPFIGFDVDPNAMTVSLSDERKQSLISEVLAFAKPGKRQTLKEFQSVAGRVNWSLAVFPLLKPCLSSVYAKMAGKSHLLAPIRVNNAIRDELLWFSKRAKESRGIFFLKTVAWDPTSDAREATVCYADASLGGLAFWFPEFNLGFQCVIPATSDQKFIFYYEALAVTCCMLQDIAHSMPRLIVYTDNQNTVDIWHSLKASAPYNDLLIMGIDALIDYNTDAHVLHIPGEDNIVADVLSHFNNELALHLVPNLRIITFTPPRGTLGDGQK
jgi:hypothetical protein